MRTYSVSIVPLLALSALLGAGCGPEPIEDTDGRPFLATPLARAESGGLELELYTRGPLEVGRNEVAYRLVESGTDRVITQATLIQKPMMTMAQHAHTCPLINPGPQADAEGRFTGTLIPTMPGGEMGRWSLEVEVLRDGSPDPVRFVLGELPVSERDLPARKDLVLGEDTYVVTLNFPRGAPAVGANDVVVTVHQSLQRGMAFPPQTDLALVMTPEMPTMGHGSSGNVNPTHSAEGEYRGVLNVNMAGAWRVTFELLRESATLGEVVYELEL